MAVSIRAHDGVPYIWIEGQDRGLSVMAPLTQADMDGLASELGRLMGTAKASKPRKGTKKAKPRNGSGLRLVVGGPEPRG